MSRKYFIACYVRKMIWAKTGYKMYNTELLVIVKLFKNQNHYLNSYKKETLILKNYDNLCLFIDLKNFGFFRIC